MNSKSRNACASKRLCCKVSSVDTFYFGCVRKQGKLKISTEEYLRRTKKKMSASIDSRAAEQWSLKRKNLSKIVFKENQFSNEKLDDHNKLKKSKFMKNKRITETETQHTKTETRLRPGTQN